MDKRKFNVGDFYRICVRCGEWVPASEQACDHCNALMQMGEFYEVSESDIPKEETKEVEKHGGLKMRCHGCNAIYEWGQYTSCPNCNGMLVAEQVEESETECEVPLSPIVAPAIAEEIAKYCYTVSRYSHGKEVFAREQKIPFGDGEMVIGRWYFATDPRLFFDAITEKIDRFYSTISSENAVLRQENGKLSIELYPRKSVIKLNGTPLRSGERRELQDGDLLRFGNGADKEHMIDVHIYKVKPHVEVADDNNQRWNQVMQELAQIKNTAEATASRLNDIEKAIETIRPEDLIIRQDENQEDLDKRIDEMVPVLSSLSMEEEITRFLQIQCKNGEVKDCRSQLEAVKERNQIINYLYQAAFLEKACAAMPEESRDYSVAINSIGRAFEEFICTEILSLVYKADASDFQEYINKNRLQEDSLQQGRILNYLLWRGKDAEAGKHWKKEGDVRIYNIVQAANYNVRDNKYFWECRNALLEMKYATGCRNGSSHAHAAGDTRKENLERYIEENANKELSYQEYQEQKERIFTTKSLSIMHKYYQRACRNENC